MSALPPKADIKHAAVVQTSDAIRYEFRAPIDQNLLRRSTGIYLAVPPSADLARLQEHIDSVELISTIWRARNGAPLSTRSRTASRRGSP